MDDDGEIHMMLESTKYRVYYLINNGICDHPDFRFLWNAVYENQGTENQVNRYTVIEAVTDEKFEDVTVKTHIETRRLASNSLERSQFRSMNWDDIDEDIVETVNSFYSERDEGDTRDRQIAYADKVQRLFEEPDSIELRLVDGVPKVSVTGLPYLYTSGRKGDFDISVEGYHGSDFLLTVDRGWGDGPMDIRMGQIDRALRDSEAYSELLGVIERHLGIHDDVW